MATTSTRNARSLIKSALRKINVVAAGEEPDATDAAEALEELNLMLKSWQNKGWNLWTITGGTLTLTTAAAYTLTPDRPVSIISARLARSGIETPMSALTRDEYDSLPLKTSKGLPTTYYYDRQREAALFYIWPLLAAPNSETISFTYEREVEDIATLSDEVDVPAEWWEAVVYSLADRLADTYEVSNPKVTQRAELLLEQAGAFDREGSVFFGEAS